MGKDGHALVGLTSQVVEERRHAAVEVAIALSVGSSKVHVVVEPLADGRVLALDVVVETVFPVSHIHFFQSVVEDRLRKSACGGELARPCQRR